MRRSEGELEVPLQRVSAVQRVLPATTRRAMIWPAAILLGLLTLGSGSPTARGDAPRAVDARAGDQLFQLKVKPLLVQKCLECHGGRKTKGGLDVRTRQGFLNAKHHGPAIVPFASASSKLMALVRRTRKPAMPPKNALSPAEIDDLARWIDLGAPFNGPLVDKARGAW